MRKKLIDSTKADIKKYMMIVESAGKVPASTREDFTLEDIENPKEVDREKFLADYATAHWSLDEMKDGTFWRKFKKYYIKK